jgi:hypothetical protein
MYHLLGHVLCVTCTEQYRLYRCENAKRSYSWSSLAQIADVPFINSHVTAKYICSMCSALKLGCTARKITKMNHKNCNVMFPPPPAN